MAERPTLSILGAPERSVLAPVAQPRDSFTRSGAPGPAITETPQGAFTRAFDKVFGALRTLAQGRIDRRRAQAKALVEREVRTDAFDDAAEEFEQRLEEAPAGERPKMVGDFFAELREKGLTVQDPNLRLWALQLYGQKKGREAGQALARLASDPSLLDPEAGADFTPNAARQRAAQIREELLGSGLIAASPLAGAAASAEFEAREADFLEQIGQRQDAAARDLARDGFETLAVQGDPAVGRGGVAHLADPGADEGEVRTAVRGILDTIDDARAAGLRPAEVLAGAVDARVRDLIAQGDVDGARLTLSRASRLRLPGSTDPRTGEVGEGLEFGVVGGAPGETLRRLRERLQSAEENEAQNGRYARDDAIGRLRLDLGSVAAEAAREARQRPGAIPRDAVAARVQARLGELEGPLLEAARLLTPGELAGVREDVVERALGRSDDAERREGEAYLRRVYDAAAGGSISPEAQADLLDAAPSSALAARARPILDGSAERADVLGRNQTAKEAESLAAEIEQLASGLPARQRAQFEAAASSALYGARDAFLARGAVVDDAVAHTEATEDFGRIISDLREGVKSAREAGVQAESRAQEGLGLALSGDMPALDTFLGEHGASLREEDFNRILGLRTTALEQQASLQVGLDQVAQSAADALVDRAFADDPEGAESVRSKAHAFVQGEVRRIVEERRAAGASVADVRSRSFEIVRESEEAARAELGLPDAEFGRPEEIALSAAERALEDAVAGEPDVWLDQVQRAIEASLERGTLPEGPLSDLVAGTSAAYQGFGDADLLQDQAFAALGSAGTPRLQQAALMAASSAGGIRLSEVVSGELERTVRVPVARPGHAVGTLNSIYGGLFSDYRSALASAPAPASAGSRTVEWSPQAGLRIVDTFGPDGNRATATIALPAGSVGPAFALHEDDLDAPVPTGERREKLRAFLGVSDEEFPAAFENARKLGLLLSSRN